MQAWEIVVIIAGFAFVALSVYLIVAIKQLTKTIANVDRLLSDNSSSVTSIVTNVDELTDNAKNAVSKVDGIASNVGNLAAGASNLFTTHYSTIKWATQIIGLAVGLISIAKNRSVAKKAKNGNSV